MARSVLEVRVLVRWVWEEEREGWMVWGEWVREERRVGDERIVARSWILYFVSTLHILKRCVERSEERKGRAALTQCAADTDVKLRHERSEDTKDAWNSTDTSSEARIPKTYDLSLRISGNQLSPGSGVCV